MKAVSTMLYRALIAGSFWLLAAMPCLAQQAVTPVSNPCQRPAAGSVVQNPPALYSSGHFLQVRFSYQHAFDAEGRELFCFMTPDGKQNPTLHLNPGDHLFITVTNNLPAGSSPMGLNGPNCGATIMTDTSINIHYHGTNTSPTCQQDEVIKTIINSGETFQYNVAFPTDEPPGLYWYHPHVHGISEHAVQGGAAGAIIVDGIQDIQPAVSGMRQRVLIVRDQTVPGEPEGEGNIPSWDVTLNYVPITSPTNPNSNNFVPAVLQMRPGDQEFWRVSNSAADTILDLQYVFDGQPQPMLVVGIDGVAVNSQDGTQPGDLIPVTHFVLPPASRVEFIVFGPTATVGLAQLITQNVNTGPIGDNDPQRPLATIQLVSSSVSESDAYVPAFKTINPNQRRFTGMANQPIAVQRTVFFDEDNTTSTFFMAVEGVPEHVFDANAPPDIVATQGTVEQWIVQNRTQENHEFHFHQLHFLVESQNDFELNGSPQVPAIGGQYVDMIQVPFWDGNPEHPFPSVTLLIDFRGSDVGDFVFHCHILEHEDNGMMNIIRVQNPIGSQSSLALEPNKKAVAKPNADSTQSSPMSMEIGNHMLEPQTEKRGPAPTPNPHKPKERQ